MYRAVLRVEWSSARRERSLWIVLGVFAVLMTFAASGSWQFVRSERAHRESAAQQEASRLAQLAAEARAIREGAPAQHNANPTEPLIVGQELLPRVASLPLAPLAPLAIGQRDILPQSLQLTTKARFAEANEADAVSPARAASGPFDPAFVLLFLLPLVIIATTFDLLSAEREGGTLALVLSQPISLTTFVLGKTTVRALLLVAVTLALTLASAVFGGARLFDPGGITAVALCAALLVAYSLFWLALSLAVNAWGRSSAANALALVGAWLALVVVVPGLASVAVDALHPSPSRVELVNLGREAARDASARASALEGDHGDPRAADAAAMKRATEVQADIEHHLEPVLQGFERRRAEQQSLVDRVRFASPALLLSEGLTDVAGSGVTRHQHFTAQVDAFHDDLKHFFDARIASGAPLDAADYAAMPRFQHVEPPAAATAGRVLPAVVGMLLMTAALCAVALVGLRRHLSRGLR